jgi:chemotaxis protein MotB
MEDVMSRKFLATGLLLMLLTGCVTTEKFEVSEAALAMCRDSLDVCRANTAAQTDRCANTQRQQQQRIDVLTQESESCRKDVAALSSRAQADLVACTEARHALETRLAATSREWSQCQKDVAAVQANVRAMSERAAQLRDQLQAEIAARDVEIEQLRDQLSVRVLDRILFRSGSAEILSAGQAVLEKLAGVFTASDDHIRVEGHTDIVPIGTMLQEKYPTNWELSTARASSVVRYFETVQKIDPLRLEAVGFSKYHPVAQGDTPEALQRNRRVEIVLTAGRPH